MGQTRILRPGARGQRHRVCASASFRAHDEKSRVLVTERGETASNYAINLESQRTPFDPGAVETATKRLQTKAFVSEVETGGEKWYRLRVGPFDQRTVAEGVLRTASKDYPRAWLAVGDDSITNDPNAAFAEPPLPPVEQMGIDPPLDPGQLKSLLDQARKAMRARDYPQAVQVLTKLQRQPEFPERAEVQELLGLSRERSGEVAQAKAEYEEYLRRYPKGPAAERISTRLRILRAASVAGRNGGFGNTENADHGWKVSGGASQLFRRDSYRNRSERTLARPQSWRTRFSRMSICSFTRTASASTPTSVPTSVMPRTSCPGISTAPRNACASRPRTWI